MKERNIPYFITAVVASILFVMAIVIRFFAFYRFNAYEYAAFVLPDYYYFIFPVVLLWLAWFFEDEKFELIGTALFIVFFALHAENAGVLTGSPWIISSYAPIVKTVYMLGLLLMLGTIVAGFYDPVKKRFSALKKPTE